MRIHKSFGLDLGTTNSTASIIKNGKVVFAEEGKAKIKPFLQLLLLEEMAVK